MKLSTIPVRLRDRLEQQRKNYEDHNNIRRPQQEQQNETWRNNSSAKVDVRSQHLFNPGNLRTVASSLINNPTNTIMNSNENTTTTAAATTTTTTTVTTAKTIDWGALENMKNKGCYSATLGELRHFHKIGRDPLEYFHTFLWSPILPEFTDVCGIEMDRYELPVTWIARDQQAQAQHQNNYFNGNNYNNDMPKGTGSGGSDTVNRRFEDLLKDKSLDDSRKLTIVFHGSPSRNIRNILENGLDPGRRRGQAYGQGEYFALDPSVCLSYCRGDKAIVVFLVLVPEKNQGQNSPSLTYGRQRIVVVNETRHQFPIGVLSFSSFTQEARTRSRHWAESIRAAQKKLEQEQEDTRNAEMKSFIIQCLIQSKTDLAARKYEKAQDSLSEAYKKEISIYVHQMMDAAIVPVIFPGLPPPFSKEEFVANTEGANATIHTVEWHAQNTEKAQNQLNQTQANFSRMREENNKRLKGYSMARLEEEHQKAAPLNLASLPEPMRSSEDAVAIASLAGKFLDGNDLFCKISQLDPKALRYKTIYELTNRVDLDLISEILSAPGDDSMTHTYWVLRGNFEHRKDVGMAVTLIKDKRPGHAAIPKCFAVMLIQNPPTKNDRYNPPIMATLGTPFVSLDLLNPFRTASKPPAAAAGTFSSPQAQKPTIPSEAVLETMSVAELKNLIGDSGLFEPGLLSQLKKKAEMVLFLKRHATNP